MEFWQDQRKIAFAEDSIGTSFALDVWEESGLAGLPFKHSASFTFEADARFYLATKYPRAAEKVTDAAGPVAASVRVPRPKPPHDLRDDAAWRKYREDSHRYRAAIREDAA
jgi:hypothetical protein